MEKKIYIQPAVQTIILTHQTIIATSPVTYDENRGTTEIMGGDALTKEEEDWELWDEE